MPLQIFDILAVNDKDFSITVYTNLAMRWKEPRLRKDDARAKRNQTVLMNPVDPLFLEDVY